MLVSFSVKLKLSLKQQNNNNNNKVKFQKLHCQDFVTVRKCKIDADMLPQTNEINNLTLNCCVPFS